MSRKSAPPTRGHTISRSNRVVPLYHQIQHLIRYRIQKGEYLPGGRIPSEHELCRELDVSRVTVREALQELVREGLLVKAQGKGTFVAPPSTTLPTIKYTGFIEEIYERVKRLSVKHVAIDRVAMTDSFRKTLQLPATEVELTRIRRLRCVADGPFSFTVNYLPMAIGSRIKEASLYKTPLLEILQDDLKVPIVRAQEIVEAAPADPEVAAELEVPVVFPVMHIRRVMFTTRDRPFEVVDTYYRADKYQYSVNLTRVRQGGKWRWEQG